MSSQLRVAKSGYNALTETDPNNFIFHSEYNTFKIIYKGSAFPTWNDTSGAEVAVNVAHGQSYTPFIFAFGRFNDLRSANPGTRDPTADFWWTKLQVDSTNMIFYAIYNGTGTYQLPITYFIVEIPL